MALDVYVGPASRFYLGDWSNAIQQEAQRRGIKYIRIDSKPSFFARLFGAKRKPQPTPEQTYQSWTAAITEGLAAARISGLAWNESPDQEFVTDRPGWEGLAALAAELLFARYPGATPPAEPMTLADLSELDEFSNELSDKSSPVIAVMGTQVFLPVSFTGSFNIWESTGVGSLDILDDAIQTICNHRGYNREQMAAQGRIEVSDEPSFDEAGRYAISIFARLVGEAVSRKLPLILDY